MSKAEILYVKGMNISESDGEDTDQDIWDDTKLNDAYDKALRIANAEVAKRVAMATNNQPKRKEEHEENKKEQFSSTGTLKGKKDKGHKWKAGMPCRALYEADGLEYEAFVLKIINNKECIVKFLGYNNTETVSINTLRPTLGKEEQARQMEQALDDKADEAYTSLSPNANGMECTSDRASSPQSTEKSFCRKKKPNKKKKNQMPKLPNGFELPNMPFPMPNMSALRNLGSMDMPLPPPPPIPLSGCSDEEEQAVSTMLLSWYMSGYYTGLYQGMKRAKENRRNV